MTDKLPPFNEYLKTHLGTGARLQTAMTWQDTYFAYMCQALEILVARGEVSGEIEGGDDIVHPSAGFTELIDPRLDNWRYFTNPFKTVTIPANQSYQLYPYTIDEWGTVLVAAIRASSPYCRMTVKVYSADGQYMDLNNTAEELKALGRVTSPTGLGFDLNKYDAVGNKYAFELRAPWPGLPFYKKVEIWLANETASDITLYDATVTLIKLDR